MSPLGTRTCYTGLSYSCKDHCISILQTLRITTGRADAVVSCLGKLDQEAKELVTGFLREQLASANTDAILQTIGHGAHLGRGVVSLIAFDLGYLYAGK